MKKKEQQAKPQSGFKKTTIGRSVTVSEIFSAARKATGLSQDEIAQKLQIQSQYVAAIESSRFESMPGEMYARGWVKKYAELLGLPTDDILALYNKEQHVRSTIRANEKKVVEKPDRRAELWKLISFKSVTFTIAIVLILGYLGYFLYESISPPDVIFDPPIEDFRTQENSIILKGHTETGALLFINGQPIDLDEQGNFSQEISLQEGLQTITIEARKERSRTYIKEVRIIKTAPPEIQESEGETGESNN